MATPMKPTIAVDGLPGWLVDELRADYAVVDIAGDDATRARALTAAGEARAVGRGGGRGVDVAFLAALPRLGLVANIGVGYDGVDLAACKARGVTVTNAPGLTDNCVADYAFGLLLASIRRIVEADRFVRSGRWAKEPAPLSRRVTGRRLGILGLGRIGMQIARRAQGFDMAVAYHNRRQRQDVPYRFAPSVVELARLSDILVVACPGGAATRNLVDAAVLDALGPSGVVVNIARGSVIDQAALLAVLSEKRIAGAGLDVFVEEPGAQAAFRDLDNVVLSPHRAGGTEETWRDCADLMKANFAAFFAGRPVTNRVEPE